MIVPRFSITQSDTLLVIKIHVPYIRVSDAEIFAENNEFTFYCKPYNLKLAFQGEISSDETCRAKYDPDEDNGVIIAELPKLIPGTYFPELDLPSKLLLDRKTADSSKYQFPTIEVVGESNNLNEDQQIDELSESFATSANLLRPHYGFNLKYCDILRHQRDEILTIFTIANPDDIPVHRRRALRNDHEVLSFDADRYLGDFLEGSDDPIHIESLAYTAFWEEMWQKKKELASQSNENQNESDEDVVFGLIGFADDEKESMRRLPNRYLTHRSFPLNRLPLGLFLFQKEESKNVVFVFPYLTFCLPIATITEPLKESRPWNQPTPSPCSLPLCPPSKVI
jgi:protein SHQ1